MDIQNVNPEEINKVNEKGLSALHLAAKSNNIETAKLLIELGADVNLQTKNEYKYTALMFAAIYSSKEFVKILLKSGADVNACDEYTSNPSDSSYQQAYGFTALIWAVRNTNNFNNIRLLLKYGADVNKTCKLGYSALMIASARSHSSSKIQILKLLLDSGADINKANNKGFTALIYALFHNKLSLSFLLDSGANVNVRANNGWTPLMIAIKYGKIEGAKLLLDNGADINAQNVNGRTSLMIAVDIMDNVAVELLLQYGTKAEIQDCNGLTALHIAATRYSEDVLNLLLSNSTSGDITPTPCLDIINIKSIKGDTPFLLFAKDFYISKNYDILKKCIDIGANINIENNYGQTPFNVSCKKVKDILLEHISFKVEDTEFGKVPRCIRCSHIAQILVTPCNHLIFCGQCGIKSKQSLEACPICKSKIEIYTRVFF